MKLVHEHSHKDALCVRDRKGVKIRCLVFNTTEVRSRQPQFPSSSVCISECQMILDFSLLTVFANDVYRHSEVQKNRHRLDEVKPIFGDHLPYRNGQE